MKRPAIFLVSTGFFIAFAGCGDQPSGPQNDIRPRADAVLSSMDQQCIEVLERLESGQEANIGPCGADGFSSGSFSARAPAYSHNGPLVGHQSCDIQARRVNKRGFLKTNHLIIKSEQLALEGLVYIGQKAEITCKTCDFADARIYGKAKWYVNGKLCEVKDRILVCQAGHDPQQEIKTESTEEEKSLWRRLWDNIF